MLLNALTSFSVGMVVLVEPKSMVARLELPLKHSLPILVTESGIVIVLRLQFLNKEVLDISVRFGGSVTEVRDLQPSNTPIHPVRLVIPLPNTNDVNCGQLLNAAAPIDVTVSGSVKEVKAQPLNAFSPMLLTVDGKLIDASLEQLLNVYPWISVSPLGNVTEVRYWS